MFSSGPDKFRGTDLEKVLKEKNVKTVVVVGTAAHGAVLYTASGAALRGEPIPVFISDLSGLPLPASAEIIVEGEMRPGDEVAEGPLGEWTGYYGAPEARRPALRVTRVMFRRNPIILGYSPCRPPSNNTLLRSLQASATIWEAMEAAGVPEVKGVWCHESGGGRLFNVVAIKQLFPGHARQAGLVASHCREAIRMGRYVVVTDEDIDIANLNEVVWAMSTRSDPSRSIEIISRTLGGDLNTAAPPEEVCTSRTIIDACRPFEWKDRFAATVGVSAEGAREIKRKWPRLFRRTVTMIDCLSLVSGVGNWVRGFAMGFNVWTIDEL